MNERDDLHCDADAANKVWSDLRAAFARSGHSIDRCKGGGYRIARGQWSVDVPSLADVARFADRAGISL